MPLYEATVYKRLVNDPGSSPWVNTYHINTVDEATALSVAEEQAGREARIHWANIQFFKVAVRLASELGTAGRQKAISFLGQRAIVDETFLPMFCTVRVTFSDDINRPDQKYLRTPIFEGEQENGVLSSGVIALILEEYIESTVADPLIVSSSNVNYTGGSVVAAVQMRQRGWHRRTREGYKRGWVPV